MGEITEEEPEEPTPPPSSPPSQPSSGGSSAPPSPPPEPEIIQTDVTLKPEQTVLVTWESVAGKLTTTHVQAKRIGAFQQDPSFMGGRIVSMRPVGGDVFYKAPTSEEWSGTMMDYYRKQYKSKGRIPQDVRKQIEIPEDVERYGLGSEYMHLGYSKSLGIDISEKESKFQTAYETKFDIEQHGLAETQLAGYKKGDPAVYMKKLGTGEYEFFYDYKRWQKEQDKKHKGDILYGVGKRLGETVGPEKWQSAIDWIAHKPVQIGDNELAKSFYKHYQMEPFKEGQEQLIAKSHYEYSQAWKTGDWGKGLSRAIGSPLVSIPLIAIPIGAATSAVGYSSWGSKSLFSLKAGKHVLTVKPATAINLGVGATFVGMGAGSLSKTYSEGGYPALEKELQRMATLAPFYMAGFRIGQSYGPRLAQQAARPYGAMKTSYQKAYQTYTPSSVKSVFHQAKQNVARYDPFFFRHYTPKFIKTYMSRVSPVSIQSRYGAYKFTQARKTFTKDIGTYGQKLYPFAVRGGAVRDVGRYGYGELRTPYRHYGTGGWWKRPEDITTMPHGRETMTYVFPTKQGMKFLSVDKDIPLKYTDYTTGTIKPIDSGFASKLMGTGKKGGVIRGISDVSSDMRMFVSGKHYYRHYLSDRGPLGVIPSYRQQPFHGIVTSEQIPSPTFTGDYSIMRSIGSYKLTKGPTTISYPSGGRLFGESFITKSISFFKKLGGSIGQPGKYGFKTIEMPELDYTKSFTGGQMDTSVTFYPKPPTSKLGFGKGTDVSIPKGGSFGGGSQISFQDFVQRPQYPSFGGIFIRQHTSLAYLESLESGVSNVSSHWKNVYSGVKPFPPVTGFMLSARTISNQKLASDIDMSMLMKMSPINIQIPTVKTMMSTKSAMDTKSINAMMTESISLSATKSIQSQIQQQKQIQQQMQVLGLKTITTPVTIKAPMKTFTPRPPHDYTFKTPPPPTPRWFDWDDDTGKKKKKKKESFGIDTSIGYRYRKQKAPSLEDLPKLKDIFPKMKQLGW